MADFRFHALSPEEVRIAIDNLPYQNKPKLIQDLETLRGIPITIGACDSTANGETLLALRVALACTDRNDLPHVIIQVTLGYLHPNAYPSVVVIRPDAPWSVRAGHRHVDIHGTCYLHSISSWNPQRSTIRNIFDDAVTRFRENYPFERRAGQQQPAPPQPQRGQQQQPQQQPVQQQVDAAIAVPLALGSMAFTALTNLVTSGSTTNTAEQQREKDMKWLKKQKDREEAAKNQTPEQMAYIAEIFKSLNSGATKPAGTVIVCPRGFGLPSIRTTTRNDHVELVERCPVPLHACTEPTPQEQFETYLAKKQSERDETRAQDLSTKTGFGKALGVLSKGSTFVSSAYASMEKKVWDDHKKSAELEFRTFFPHNNEPFVETYPCSQMDGEGRLNAGAMYITSLSVSFRSTDATLSFTQPLATVVCIIRGVCLDSQWILLVLSTNKVIVFSHFTSTLGKVATILSGLTGSASDRAYNWLDHMWRAATPVPTPGYGYATSSGGSDTPLNQSLSAPTPPTASGDGGASTPEAMQCIVCMDAARNAFFQPCGHMVCCMRCAGTLQGVCPMCRTPIQATFQAFT